MPLRHALGSHGGGTDASGVFQTGFLVLKRRQCTKAGTVDVKLRTSCEVRSSLEFDGPGRTKVLPHGLLFAATVCYSPPTVCYSPPHGLLFAAHGSLFAAQDVDRRDRGGAPRRQVTREQPDCRQHERRSSVGRWLART